MLFKENIITVIQNTLNAHAFESIFGQTEIFYLTSIAGIRQKIRVPSPLKTVFESIHFSSHEHATRNTLSKTKTLKT